MSRFNEGQGGAINWPTDARDSGEGGMWVYALVAAQNPEPFSHCHGVEATVHLPMPDVVVSDNREKYYGDMPHFHHVFEPAPAEEAEDFPGSVHEVCTQCRTTRTYVQGDPGGPAYLANEECPEYERLVMFGNHPILAAVCLGSSNGAWSYYDYMNGDEELQARGRARGDDVYWRCRFDDLTEVGKTIVRSLSDVYGRDVDLVTYLDDLVTYLDT